MSDSMDHDTSVQEYMLKSSEYKRKAAEVFVLRCQLERHDGAKKVCKINAVDVMTTVLDLNKADEITLRKTLEELGASVVLYWKAVRANKDNYHDMYRNSGYETIQRMDAIHGEFVIELPLATLHLGFHKCDLLCYMHKTCVQKFDWRDSASTSRFTYWKSPMSTEYVRLNMITTEEKLHRNVEPRDLILPPDVHQKYQIIINMFDRHVFRTLTPEYLKTMSDALPVGCIINGDGPVWTQFGSSKA